MTIFFFTISTIDLSQLSRVYADGQKKKTFAAAHCTQTLVNIHFFFFF